MDTTTILTSEKLTNAGAISLICNSITMTSKDAPIKEVGKVGVAGLVVKHGEGGGKKSIVIKCCHNGDCVIVHVSDKIYEDVSTSDYHFIAIALPSCDITLLKVVDVLSFENYTNEGDFLKGLVVLDEDEFFMAVREVLRKLSETITNNLIQKH